MDGLAHHLLVGVLALVHHDDVIRRSLDLGSGIGGLAAAEGARLQLEDLALAVDPLIDLGVEEDLGGVIRGEPGDDAAEEEVGLLIDRERRSRPTARS